MPEPQIVLTDAKPLPKDDTCPRCRGTERVLTAGFGNPAEACAKCGHQFTEAQQ